MNIGSRLKTAAELVRQNSRLADIGTDHAYLPAYLVLSGRVVSAIACDIVKGPLDNALNTLKEYNLTEKIELRLCDGLQGVKDNEVDDIVICGMGGELIATIIDNAKWVKSPDIHLVLQPMSAVDDLRSYLSSNGFRVDEEVLVKDGKRLYIVLSVYYTGENTDISADYLLVGNVTVDQPHGREYLEAQLKRLEKHVQMLLNTDKPNERAELLKIISAIKERLE